MNQLERKMTDILIDLKENYAAESVKAEFEAEGTRIPELQRLKEICLNADISLMLKIGGAMTSRDLKTAQAYRVSSVIAPMIESKEAFEAFMSRAHPINPEIRRLINIETFRAVEQLDEILSSSYTPMLDGIVIGRSDLIGSMQISEKSEVDSDYLFDLNSQVISKGKKAGLKDLIVGGTVTAHSISFLKRLLPLGLTGFETRKIRLNAEQNLSDPEKAEEGIHKAIYFELLWLQNKRNDYLQISGEDNNRIAQLEKRLHAYEFQFYR